MRTLNDIVPPSRRKELEPIHQYPTGSKDPLNLSTPPRKFSYKTIVLSAVVILIAIFALFYYATAKVKVIPNTISAEVNSSFTAQRDSDTLPFKIITAQKITSQTVKGSGTKAVSSSASGTITIYNTQSSSQKLITNTRFATTAGIVFRIHSPITIPGGSSTKPGSIAVKVYADKPGSAYNIDATSFIIPGFIGMSQEGKVYAKSTSAMTGGSSGNVPIIDSALEEETRNDINESLEPDLIANLETLIPSDYTLLEGASVLQYQPVESAPSSTEGMVEVRQQGTITAIVFPTGTLSKTIAESITGLAYNGEPLTLAPTSKLVFSSKDDIIKEGVSSISFTVSGAASLVYTVDPIRIAAVVSGKTRSEALIALKNYPEVRGAFIILRPFWRQTMPQDPTSISIVLANP